MRATTLARLVVVLAIVLVAAPAAPAGAQTAGDPQRGEVTLRCQTDEHQPWVAFEVTATVRVAYTGSFRWIEAVDEPELRLTEVTGGVQPLANSGAQVDERHGTALVWGQVAFVIGWDWMPSHATCMAEYDPYDREAVSAPEPAPPEAEASTPAPPTGDELRYGVR